MTAFRVVVHKYRCCRVFPHLCSCGKTSLLKSFLGIIHDKFLSKGIDEMLGPSADNEFIGIGLCELNGVADDISPESARGADEHRVVFARFHARQRHDVALSAADFLKFIENAVVEHQHHRGVGKVVLDTSLKVLRNTKVEKPENLIFIKDGDDLSAYGFDAKIIGMPGHTKGSIGVDVEGTHLLVGDELDNWISPATGHLYNDLDAIKNSADKIVKLGERTLYYGHGKPTKNKFKLL